MNEIRTKSSQLRRKGDIDKEGRSDGQRGNNDFMCHVTTLNPASRKFTCQNSAIDKIRG